MVGVFRHVGSDPTLSVELEQRSADDLVPTPANSRTLTAPEFHQFAQVPPAAEWLTNIDNPNIRRAYSRDLQETPRLSK